MKKPRPAATTQPRPLAPGVTRKMVRDHAQRIFPDVIPTRPLTLREWQMVEQDLLRWLENTGF